MRKIVVLVENAVNEKGDLISLLSLVLLMFVAETTYVFAAMSGNYNFIGIVTLLALALGFFYMIPLLKNIKIKKDFFIISYGLFWIYTFTKFKFPEHKADIFFYLSGYLMIVMSSYFKNVFKDDLIWKIILVFAVIFALGVILQRVFTDFFMENYYPLFSEEFKKSIYKQVVWFEMYPGWVHQTLAACFNIFPGVVIVVMQLKNKKNMVLNSILLIIFSIAFLLTGRRGPLLFGIMAFCITIVFAAQTKKEALIRLIKIILMAFFMLFLLISLGKKVDTNKTIEDSGNSIIRILQIEKGKDASNGRFRLWKLAIDKATEKPLTGIGWRQYNKIAEKELGLDCHTHNVFLQLLAETGILGVVLFLIPIIYAIFDSFRMHIRCVKINNKKLADTFIRLSILQVFFFLCFCTESVIFYYSYQIFCCLIYCMYVAAKNSFKNVTK